MKLSKTLILFLLFYFLTLLQTSFLIHYSWHNAGIHLVLLIFVLLLFNKKKDIKEGLVLAVLAGFFIDIFSSYFFGLFILLFIILFFLVSYLKKRISANNFSGYCLILLLTILIYNLLFFLISYKFSFLDVLYNFLVGVVIYFISKAIYVLKQGFGK